MNEIPDAYNEAIKHVQEEPCKALNETTQKEKQILQPNLKDNARYLFWNNSEPSKEKAG